MEVSTDDPRTELDSHAKMVFLGSNLFVLESTGRTFNIQPFNSDLGMVKGLPMVDRSLSCDYPCTEKVCTLVIRNVLHDASMHHNLIPSFIMRS